MASKSVLVTPGRSSPETVTNRVCFAKSGTLQGYRRGNWALTRSRHTVCGSVQRVTCGAGQGDRAQQADDGPQHHGARPAVSRGERKDVDPSAERVVDHQRGEAPGYHAANKVARIRDEPARERRSGEAEEEATGHLQEQPANGQLT